MKIAKKLLIRAKKNIFGELAGNNISLKSGDGFDFFELRPYNLGEDVRRIDWKSSAKMNEPYVKLFHEEKQVQVLIAPILSGSLMFGLQRLKQETLCEIIALLGFSALKNSDTYSIIYEQNKQIQASKLSKNEAFLYKSVESLLAQNLLGVKANINELKSYIQKRYKRRSLIVFIGDFWEIPKLKSLSVKHEVLCIVVRDRFEESPKQIGQIRQINPEELSINNLFLDKSSIEKQIKKAKAHDAKLAKALLSAGVRMQKVYTDENVYAKLAHFLRA